MNKEMAVDKARTIWEIIAAIAAIIGLVVSVTVGIAAYNTRYDSSCEASDGFKMTFKTNSNVAATSLTASAGSVWYGAWQKSGKANTSYSFYYKKSSKTEYKQCPKFSLTFTSNGKKYAQGDWRLARSKNSQKYDVKVLRTSNKGTKSVLRVDWAVDSYKATN